MAEMHTYSRLYEQEKEIVNILIDSDFYFDMGLQERFLLLHRILTSYYES